MIIARKQNKSRYKRIAQSVQTLGRAVFREFLLCAKHLERSWLSNSFTIPVLFLSLREGKSGICYREQQLL